MSARPKDGGPAFPHSGFDAQGLYPADSQGMTLRDYFMAHAPHEPQRWFEPRMPPEPVKPSYPDNLTQNERDEITGHEEWIDIREMTQQRAIDYCTRLEKYQREKASWDVDYAKKRFIQWPAAWADAMLAERTKG